MDRQKPRVSRTIDGFNSGPSRSHYYIDGVYRPSQTRRQVNTNSTSPKALPALQPRPIPYARTQSAITPQPSVQPGINRSQFIRSGLPMEGILATEPRAKVSQPVSLPALNNRSAALRGGSLATEGFIRSSNKPKSKWKSPKRIIKTTAIVFAVLVLGFGGWFASSLVGNLNKVFHGNIYSDAKALISNATLKGENQGRVNILLAGYQGKASDEGPLTDSIMIVSMDTRNHTAFTMSVPRDLWVNIPGMGHAKINAANTNSNFSQAGYFKGGMGQLQAVIEQNMGIPIDYYALIDYSAFQDSVNAVGGITVNIQSPDPRGLYDPNVDKAHGGPLKLPNGKVQLNGAQALALAIARGDSPYSYGFPQSDINRTQHQRQMLIALEQKALTAGVLGNPITIAHLVSVLGSNVKTNLSLADVLSLAHLAKSVNLANIQSHGLNYAGSNPLLKTYLAPDGEDALIPKAGVDNFSQIRNYYLRLVSNNPVAIEAPTVTLLNASTVSGLAAKEQTILESKGFNVVTIADASAEYPSTLIVDNTNGQKPASDKAIRSDINGSVVTSVSGSAEAQEAANYNSNFVVIMGKNWDGSQNSSLPVQN